MLPSVKSLAGESNYFISPPDDRRSRVSASPGLKNMPSLINNNNTLPPMLGHGLGPTSIPYTSHGPPHQNGIGSNVNGSLHHSAFPPASASQPLPTSAAALALLNNSFHSQLNHDPDTKSPTFALDAEIASLESQIANLRKYEQDFIALGLDESRNSLRKELEGLEERMRAKRREKGKVLIDRLKREGFGGLAEVVGREVGVGVQNGELTNIAGVPSVG